MSPSVIQVLTTANNSSNSSDYRWNCSEPGAYGAGILYAGGNTAFGGGTAVAPTALNITSAANASAAVTELEAAINGAAAERAKYGAYVSRLQHAADNLSNVSTNTAASKSRIADADYARKRLSLLVHKSSRRPAPRCSPRRIKSSRPSCRCYSRVWN